MSLKEQIEYLSGFALPARVEAMRNKLKYRTRYLTVCLENIYQSQNASAVIRSCDAFGVQDLHVIENIYDYQLNPDVSMGAEKWITLNRYEGSSAGVVEHLRSEGYRIIATSPVEKGTSLDVFNLMAGKCAFFFGTELSGLSPDILNRADELLYIPMRGFVESLNISVSAAVIMHELTVRLRRRKTGWQLTDEEHDTLMLHWLKLSVRSSEMILARMNKQ
jgi:tRNA (guanosine-2'-O-)-methyltransferase